MPSCDPAQVPVTEEGAGGANPSMASIIRRRTVPYVRITSAALFVCSCAFGRITLIARWGASLTLNYGYGHGFSVREVIEMVKRVFSISLLRLILKFRPK